MPKSILTIIIICLLFIAGDCYAQAPQISYGNNRFFLLDSALIPFMPVNNGGAVPSRAYSQTTTFAGNGNPSNLNGNGITAGFNRPSGIIAGKDGDLYITDEKNNSIRKISRAGEVTTIATGFNGPGGIALDLAGNIYVADSYNHRICRISPSGKVTPFAGSGKPGDTDHSNGLLAQFRYPVSIATDTSGNIYVSDEGNNKIRKISPQGVVSTLAGTGSPGSLDHINGKLASFAQPSGLTVDKTGAVYVADQLNHKIRKISPAGSVSTLAGTGYAGAANNADPLLASFDNPRAIAIDAAGWIYICDTGNRLIRRIGSDGEVTTLAGSGASGSTDHRNGSLASFFFPNDLAATEAGLFVTDCLNNTIRKIEITGYDVSPSVFPQGVSFDYTSGMISGKPAAFFPGQTYKVSAYNSAGSHSVALTLSASAQPGNALNFDGRDDIIVIQDAPVLTPKVLTAQMWVKPGNAKGNYRFLIKRLMLPMFDDSYTMGFDTLGRFMATICSGAETLSGQVWVRQKKPAIPNKWYFLSVVYSETSLRMYIDGELEAEAKTGFPIAKGVNMFFNFDRGLQMTIDEVRLYNHDRSGSIASDMMHPPGKDDPGLITYYDFNTGTPFGNKNSGYNILYDRTNNRNNGDMQQFFQSGASVSNWVESYAMVVPVVHAASVISSTGFTASWTAPVLGKADHYLLEVAADRQFTQTLDGYKDKIVSGTRQQVNGLKPETEYFFRVRACKPGSDEEGGYSQIQRVFTGPASTGL